MQDRGILGRIAIFTTVVALTAGAFALPAAASGHRANSGYPPAAAIRAWSAGYAAQWRLYRSRLEAQSSAQRPSPAAIAAWSSGYAAQWDLYQQQQLAQAERQASAFNWTDAVIGGGIVLALAAVSLAGIAVLRSRRLAGIAS